MENRKIEFHVGDQIGLDRKYTIQSKKRGAAVGSRAEALGTGGQAGVYRVTYREDLEGALKILQVGHEINTGDSEPLKRSFMREKSILARLTHTNLAKVLDYGVHSDSGHTYPYIVTEFVDGARLDEAWIADAMNGRTFLKMFQDILSAIGYLHRQGILHADLKERNILFRTDIGALTPFVLDLGAAKVIDRHAQPFLADAVDGSELMSRENTLFLSTRRIAPEIWAERVGQEITRDQLAEMFPDYDLHAVGVLLERALKTKGLRERIVGDLHEQGLNSLKMIAERLKGVAEDRYYSSADAVARDFAKLDPHFLAPLGVPELALSARFHHSVVTMRGRIVVTDRLHEVMSHPVFQRLRDIPQLELVSHTYPGATHSRMLHSLSCLGVAREYIAQLLNIPTFRLAVSPEDLQAALLMALLHDIGHFPLSHMFEDFSEEQRRHPKRGILIPTDDDLFWTFFDPVEHAAEGYEELAAVIRSRGESLMSLVESTYGVEVVDSLESLLATSHSDGTAVKPSHAILSGLLSSAIDADKVAYLADDSFASGVAYGKGIDLDGLLGALTMPPEPALRAGHRPIAILEKGLSAAESVSTARYFMLRRVYWHHTNRAVMSMFKAAIGLLIDSGCFSMPDYLAKMAFGTQQQAFSYLSEAFDRAAAAGWYAPERVPEWFRGTQNVRKSFEGVLGGHREIYKRLLEVSLSPSPQDGELYESLVCKGWRELLEVQEGLRSYLVENVPSLQGLIMGDVIIDVPVKEREGVAGRGGGDVWVYPERPDSPPVLLKQASPIVKALDEEFDAYVKKCRVFLHPEMAQLARSAGEFDRAAVAAREYLKPSHRSSGMS